MTVQAHADAFLALLDADNTPPALVVLDGAVPQGQTPPYVLVYVTVLTPVASTSTPLTMVSQRVVATAYLHCVATTARSARAMAQRARAALLDVVPAIAGRVCWPIRHMENQPPQRDETTGELVFDQVDLYRLESVPST
jgi:hypothetical protein